MTAPLYVSTRGGAPGVPFREALLDGLAPDGGLYVPTHVPALPDDWARGGDARGGGRPRPGRVAPRGGPPRRAGGRRPLVPRPARPGRRRRRLRAGAVPRADAVVQGRRRAHDGAADGGRPGRRGGDDPGRDLGRHGQRGRRRVRRRAGRPRGPALPPGPGQRGPGAAAGRRAATASRRSRSRAPSTTASGWSRPRSPTAPRPGAGSRRPTRSTSGGCCPRCSTTSGPCASWASSPVFVVPSGNLGNLTAGTLAQRAGLPVAGFVAAHNANDGFPRFLSAATPRPATPCGRCRTRWTWACRATWSGSGRCRPTPTCARSSRARRSPTTRRRPRCAASTTRPGYLADPHTAVGLEAARRLRARGDVRPVVVLSTAHPAKFPEAVADATGVTPPAPPRLAALWDAPTAVETIPADLDALRPHLA